MGQSNSILQIERKIKQNPKFIKMTDNVITDFELRDIDINSNKKWGDCQDNFPSDINGLFLSSGADRDGNEKIGHLLDGYNHAIKVEIKNGKINLIVKRLVDDVYLTETQTKTIIKKGLYDLKTSNNLFDFDMARNMFHQAIYFRDTYIGCTGGNWIYIDPNTCEVKENFKLDKKYDTHCKLIQKCMHPLIDYKKNVLISFTFTYGFSLEGMKTIITFYEFDNNNTTINKVNYEIKGMTFLHGFQYTDKYYILFNIPMKPNVLGFVFGKNAIMRNVDDVTSDKLIIHLIPRQQGLQPIIIDTNDHGFVYHGINAYDDQNNIILDVFLSDLNAERESSQFEVNDKYNVYCNDGELYRYTINLDNRSVSKKTIAKIVQSTIDFRSVNQQYHNKPYSYSYMCAHDIDTRFCSLFKIDMNNSYVVDEYTSADTDHFWFREPQFISNINPTGEDDGYIFMWCYRVDDISEKFPFGQTELYIFNAKNLSLGPQYVINVSELSGKNKPIPYGMHSYIKNFH
jgi:carotenoid cleavage dioxygenase-like enzyme